MVGRGGHFVERVCPSECEHCDAVHLAAAAVTTWWKGNERTEPGRSADLPIARVADCRLLPTPIPPPPTRPPDLSGGLLNVCCSSHIVSVTRICPASRLLLLPFLSPRLLFHLSSQVSKLLISRFSSFDLRSASSRRSRCMRNMRHGVRVCWRTDVDLHGGLKQKGNKKEKTINLSLFFN